MRREPRLMLWLMKLLRVDLPADGLQRAFLLNATLYGTEFAVLMGALGCVVDMAWGVPLDAGAIGRSMLFGGLFFGLLMAWMRSRAR